MIKLSTILQAYIPLVTVSTADEVYAPTELQKIIKKPVEQYTPSSAKIESKRIYWASSDINVTRSLYNAFKSKESSLIILNFEEVSPFVVFVGELPTNEDIIERSINLNTLIKDTAEEALKISKGHTVTQVTNALKVVKSNKVKATALDVFKTFLKRGQPLAIGLSELEPLTSTYSYQDDLENWLNLNKPYFFKEDLPKGLRPRGLMLSGKAGVGKTMASKAIASSLDVKLLRLDLTAIIDKYLGVSEFRVKQALASVEQHAPCVLLLDEIEKLFMEGEETGAVTRILSQLLWWLAEHNSPVITIMTSNNLSKIPPELYRAGRVDKTFIIQELKLEEACTFVATTYKDILGTTPTAAHLKTLKKELSNEVEIIKAENGLAMISHARVVEVLYTTIKKNGWI